ncbi:MAG: fumarate reductase/succinate dehydrogenase flavoprotein subunit [Candidatus Thorarchaeota archaeon]|nr:MAG: fumarate reductase/succinate dehydrogenase flavoprotein subunit [Candidatus Thorarchaeota archaeon]
MDYKTIMCDVLVVGAGGAGCRAAIEAANRNLDVIIISKELLGKAHTAMAEGGYNVSLGNVDPDDNPETHFKDTIVGGNYLNNQKLAEILVEQASRRVFDLEDMGAVFDRTPEGKIAQRTFGKQSWRRTAYASDRTGSEIMVTLTEAIRKTSVRVFDEVFATRLLVTDGKIAGVCAVDLKYGDYLVFRAKSVVMATGGAGRIFKVTSNAQLDVGDGYGMAYEAGCDMVDMEMIQFHPTGMVKPESARGRLVTEAVRGEGGILLNSEGERFMHRYYPQVMELAGRDQVARSIMTEVLEGRGSPDGGAYLSIAHLPRSIIEFRLESMIEQFEDAGVDIRNEPMEVSPTAHHFMGGIKIDVDASTTIPGLYAAGECTGGVHGGNRLGGNALADTQVFGAISGESAAEYAKNHAHLGVNHDEVLEEFQRLEAMLSRKEGISPADARDELTELMWSKVQIFRKEEDLQEAVNELRRIEKEVVPNIKVDVPLKRFNPGWHQAIEFVHMVTTARMVAEAALMRKGSRGAHYRVDADPNEKGYYNIVIRKGKDGEMELEKQDLVITKITPP